MLQLLTMIIIECSRRPEWISCSHIDTCLEYYDRNICIWANQVFHDSIPSATLNTSSNFNKDVVAM